MTMKSRFLRVAATTKRGMSCKGALRAQSACFLAGAERVRVPVLERGGGSGFLLARCLAGSERVQVPELGDALIFTLGRPR